MWLLISQLPLFLCFLLDCVQSLNWTHYRVLDDDRKVHLYWELPENKSDGREICFKVVMEANGYFALGFSPNGGMPGSDILTGWIKSGKIYFQDRHAVDFILPPKDEQQNYELIAAYENDTFTVFEFCRKFDTCDKNDMVIDKSTMRVIYAYSNEDPDDDDPFYHREKRGVRSVILLRNKYPEEVDLSNSSFLTWDVTSPGINISSDTLYWCKIFKTPNVSKKHHIFYVTPLIEEGHAKFLHHMGIYECPDGTSEEFEHLLDEKGHECWLPTMPVQMMTCQALTIAWAAGGEDIVLPEYVGFPLEPNRFFMFEIHYDNPEHLNGIIDHSGYRLYYTPNLRKYDAGNLMIGAASLPKAFIPPVQEKYVVVGHTGPQCIPWIDSGIKVLAVHPHAHSLAQEIKVRHFRGDNELIPLAEEKNYDFKYQQYRFYTEEVDIKPGDQVTVECTYNSTTRDNVTLGGQTSKDEMCITFLMYYPRSYKFLAFSGPSFADINKVLDINVTSEADIIRDLGTYDWSKVNISEVENVMRYTKHETYCYYGDFPEDGVNPLVAYPSNFTPYKPESRCKNLV